MRSYATEESLFCLGWNAQKSRWLSGFLVPIISYEKMPRKIKIHSCWAFFPGELHSIMTNCSASYRLDEIVTSSNGVEAKASALVVAFWFRAAAGEVG